MLKMIIKILNIKIFCKKIFFLAASVFCVMGMSAQEVSVTARLDSARIVIGDHLIMHLSLSRYLRQMGNADYLSAFLQPGISTTYSHFIHHTRHSGCYLP